MKMLLKIVVSFVTLLILVLSLVWYFTAGMAKAADEFFSAVKNQDLATARGYLAADFMASSDERALRDFLSRGALLDVKRTTWSNRRISGGQGALEGNAVTESGGVIPLKLTFVKENGAWKIYSISKPTAGLLSENSSATIPSDADKIHLVKRTMHDFAVSVNAKNMAHFHATTAKLCQQELSVEKLDAAFTGFYDNGDLTLLDAVTPIVEPVLGLREDGALVLKGKFPIQQQEVHFEQKYFYEGMAWKLFGLSIKIKDKDLEQMPA